MNRERSVGALNHARVSRVPAEPLYLNDRGLATSLPDISRARSLSLPLPVRSRARCELAAGELSARLFSALFRGINARRAPGIPVIRRLVPLSSFFFFFSSEKE